MKKILIFGHKKPDTDSVVASIALSYLKNKLGFNTEPRILGEINNETKYILNYFNVPVPKYLNDVKLQIKDVNYSKGYEIDEKKSIFNCYNYIKNNKISTLPIINSKGEFLGATSMKDIARDLIENNSEILNTSYQNIIETLNGKAITSFDEEIEGTILIAGYKSTTFIENVNSYNGYYLYKTNTENKVIAISDIWTEYTKDEIIYKDKNENSVKIPKGFKICQTPKKNNVEDGLVIKDENNNSFIWIEVPKKVTEDAENEDEIEKSLQEYVGNYKKEEYEDQWYEGCGISTEKEYKEQKNKMLNSIKENGGFWLGQYEVGTQTQRKNLNDILTKAVCEKGAYPYNYITPKQAQTLANTFTVENYSCSLMYGIQWDLVCKFIEKYKKNPGTTENTIKNMINANSSDFANYKNTSFKLFSGKYSEDNGITWKQIDKKAYTKQEGKSVIATTGTSIRNKILNIYDIAGNVEEITLQKNINEDNFASRGGSYNSENVGISEISINNESGYDLGFRITLY